VARERGAPRRRAAWPGGGGAEAVEEGPAAPDAPPERAHGGGAREADGLRR